MGALDADEDDPDEPFVRVPDGGPEYRGELVPPTALEEAVFFGGDEGSWRQAGAEMPDWVPRMMDEPEALPAPTAKREGRKKKRDSGSGPE